MSIDNEVEAWLVLRQILLCGSALCRDGLCACIYDMAAVHVYRGHVTAPLISDNVKSNMLHKIDREWHIKRCDMKFPHRHAQWFDNGFLYPPGHVAPRIALCERFAIEVAAAAVSEVQGAISLEQSKHNYTVRTLARDKAVVYATLRAVQEFVK